MVTLVANSDANTGMCMCALSVSDGMCLLSARWSTTVADSSLPMLASTSGVYIGTSEDKGAAVIDTHTVFNEQ